MKQKSKVNFKSTIKAWLLYRVN